MFYVKAELGGSIFLQLLCNLWVDSLYFRYYWVLLSMGITTLGISIHAFAGKCVAWSGFQIPPSRHGRVRSHNRLPVQHKLSPPSPERTTVRLRSPPPRVSYHSTKLPLVLRRVFLYRKNEQASSTASIGPYSSHACPSTGPFSYHHMLGSRHR